MSNALAPDAHTSTSRPLEQQHERRQRRSHDPLVALHYHLAESRKRDALSAIVVADGQGIVVGGAGAWPICEEMAAYAPMLSAGSDGQLDGRARELAEHVWVRSFRAGGDEVLLCGRGPRASADRVQSVIDGVARILA
jgi:hypothetical protein